MRKLIQAINAPAPAQEFDKVLMQSRSRVLSSNSNAGETEFSAGIVTDKTISDLNSIAASCFDVNVNSVKFYGGFIHKTPLAKFKAISLSGAADRKCELGDLLIITVRSDVVASTTTTTGGLTSTTRTVTQEKRACFIQAKLSDVPKGTKVCNFDLLGPLPPRNVPAKGSEAAQLYLYNLWPKFTLSGQPKTSYDLRRLIPTPRAVCKYGHVLTTQDESLSPRPWTMPHDHVWEYAEPVPNATSNGTLGEFLMRIAQLDSGAGASYSPSTLQPQVSDWPALIDELTDRCSLAKWSGSRVANPASIDVRSWLSIFDDVHWFESASNLNHRFSDDQLSYLMDSWAEHRSPRRARSMRLSGKRSRMPVLFVLVRSRSHKDDKVPA